MLKFKIISLVFILFSLFCSPVSAMTISGQWNYNGVVDVYDNNGVHADGYEWRAEGEINFDTISGEF